MDIIKKYIYGKKITRKNKNKKSTSKKTKKRKNILKVNKLSNGLHYNISNIPEYNKVCIYVDLKCVQVLPGITITITTSIINTSLLLRYDDKFEYI